MVKCLNLSIILSSFVVMALSQLSKTGLSINGTISGNIAKFSISKSIGGFLGFGFGLSMNAGDVFIIEIQRQLRQSEVVF